MKLKGLIAAAIAVLTLIVGAGLQSQSASATTPPGQDHAFHVTLSTTVAPSNPDINVDLTLCTNGNGIGGTANECTASTPASPFFDEATANFKGVKVNGAQPVGARTASITFDIETNGGVIQGAGANQGQRANCGTVAHIAPPTFEIWAGVKTGTVVSQDPSGTPGFGFDQLDDPLEANPGAPQGDGWPQGISQVPSVVPAIKLLAGIPDAAVIARGYGVAVVAFGVSQTTVTFLTIATGGAPGTADAIANITVLGNPFGTASTTAQNTTTCPPFFSSVLSRGTALNSLGSKAINGTTPPDRVTPATGVFNNTICDVGCTAGYTYDILLSSTGDDDADGVNNAVDNCPTVPNPGQASFAGIGIACNAGQGYDNNNAAALAALAACTIPATCTDIDGDGFLNAADNCPFVANPNQKNADGDSRGDACEGNGTDPTLAPKDNPIASVKGDGTGYINGREPGMVTTGTLDDHSDICKVAFTTGSATPVTPATVCLAFGVTDSPPGPGLVWQDSNNDGVPDFLCVGGCTSGNVTRDHKADANGDGYSDADEGTPANCGAGSCGSIVTFGTGETNSCRNAGRNCGTGAATDWNPLTRAKDAPGGPGTGCLKTLDETTSLKTTNLAKADVDLDGSVSILDLSKIASWFGNPVKGATDPRFEGNLDGDGSISILDLSAAAANFGRSVNGNCLIQ